MRLTARTAAVVSAIVVLSACGDRRLGKLTEGIARDSVAVVMGTDAPYREQQFLTEGKLWEVLLYTRDNATPTDSVAWRELSPVVIADGKVTGWGWDYWEDQAEALKIPGPADD